MQRPTVHGIARRWKIFALLGMKKYATSQSHLMISGGLEHVLFSHILGIMIPIDFHIFQRGTVGLNHQPDLYFQNLNTSFYIHFLVQLVVFREKLQENPIFHGNIYDFL